MHRSSALALLVFCLPLQPLHGQTPDDLKFELRLLGDRHAFHAGEAIPLEFSLSTDSEKKYQGSFHTPSPERDEPKIEVTPSQGTVNVRSLQNGFAGSWLSSIGFMTTTPQTEHMDLTDWYLFRKTGHYSVRLLSSTISRVKTADQPGERLNLESNAMEFDILPPDTEWATDQQSKLDEVLSTQPSDSQAWRDAVKRLGRLDTPASAEKLIEIYLSSARTQGWEVNSAIRETLQTDVVVPVLLAALTNPSVNPPDGIADLIADLQTRGKLGVPPDYPGEQTPEWKATWEERQKTREEFFQQANDLLLSSAQKRTGPNRAAAIYQAWWNAEARKQSSGISQESMEQIRNSVLAVRDELPPDLQRQFAYTGWQSLPHAPLLPLVRKFAKESLDKAFSTGGYEYVASWCQDEPDSCDEAILETVRKPGLANYKPAVLLLPESQHAELDEWLREELRNPEMIANANSQTIAALILRAGSENLVPDVVQRLDKLSSNHGECDMTADLLGYMFRFKTKEAAKRLTSVLQSADDRCAGQVLRTLNTDRYSDDLIRPALAGLQSPNLQAVGSAALFLAAHGPRDTEATLMKRLDVLHEMWRDRASELNDVQPILSETPQRQATQLEQELASALMGGKEWQLSPSEVEHLRGTCLTDQCRSIADRKMSLGF